MRQSLSTGLYKVLDLVFPSTLRTSPWESVMVCTTLPRSHELWGVLSSRIRTMCPGARFCFTLVPCWGSCRSGRYRSDMYCVCFHLRRVEQSSLQLSPGGGNGCFFNNSRWFGSSDDVVRGLSFSMASTSHSLFAHEGQTLRPSFTCLSHPAPKWGPAGGLHIHWIPFWARASCIVSWFHCCIAARNSVSALTRLVPLSDVISDR